MDEQLSNMVMADVYWMSPYSLIWGLFISSNQVHPQYYNVAIISIIVSRLELQHPGKVTVI